MKKHGMTLAQALQHVKSKRPVASPNAGFIRQLQDLEKSMQGMPYYNILRSRLLGWDLCGESKLEILCLSDSVVSDQFFSFWGWKASGCGGEDSSM